MSSTYIRRLRGVQTEFEAAKQALAYVERHWQQQIIYQEVPRLSPRDFAQASHNIEQTYFIRLYAEFEGVLKDHLTTNHPFVKVPDKPVIDWLIRRTVQAETLTVHPALRLKLDAVRNYRNAIAHHGRGSTPAITLVAALSTLNTFLAKLPEPLA